MGRCMSVQCPTCGVTNKSLCHKNRYTPGLVGGGGGGSSYAIARKGHHPVFLQVPLCSQSIQAPFPPLTPTTSPFLHTGQWPRSWGP